ncbi:MAG: subclass B3 metallo-beta-lactamase [Pseudomonadota bacterium]
MRRLTGLLCLTLSLGACQSPIPTDTDTPSAAAPWIQWGESNPTWIEPITPYRVAQNVYFVGTKGLGSYLITTPDGHYLLDGGLPQNAPMIVQSITELGFAIQDVKVLLNSHAHFDHSGGLAELKRLSGARLVAMEGDRSALEQGVYLGSEDNLSFSAPPVEVDEVIAHGDVLSLGGVALTAVHMPGHSRGCTSWTMPVRYHNKTLSLMFFCSASVAANSLEPEQYPGIVEDYRLTFARARAMQPDIVVSGHPDYYFDQLARMRRSKFEGADAFVDTTLLGKALLSAERHFTTRLANEQNFSDQMEAFAFAHVVPSSNTDYLFYLHGKIIEDQGLAAVSPMLGEYQYVSILQTLAAHGFDVISRARPQGADVEIEANRIAEQVRTLMRQGVPASRITIAGASKGAFIAARVSSLLDDSTVNIVLLAGCSADAMAIAEQHAITLSGRVLAVYDVADRWAGSCAPLVQSSTRVSEFQELRVQDGTGHGLIYTPSPSWVEPLVSFVRRPPIVR